MPMTIASLKRAFQTNRLDKAQVIAKAKEEGLDLPADFFADTPRNPVGDEVRAPQTFGADQGSANTGAGRIAELRGQANRAPRELPNPAPSRIRIGRMNLKKLAQTKDMILYINYIDRRPTLFYVMAKLDPETALKPKGGFSKDRKGVMLADRDGVVKDSRFLNEPDKEQTQDVMIPSALEAAKKLDDNDIALVLVTNQGGYETGKMTFEDTLAINVRVSQQIANAGGHLDAVFICPFSSELKDAPEGVHDARKPSSGMTLYAKQLAEAKGIKVIGMAGDQRTDGAAAQGAGLKFNAVTDGNGRWADELATAQRKNETLPTLNKDPAVYKEFGSFADVVNDILP
jgi:D-glycero-D-manno-heptose 1,7-bisphosphate phosphatase